MQNLVSECESLADEFLIEGPPRGLNIHRLAGDASTRSYYRIVLSPDQSIVLMLMPEPFEPKNFAYLDNYHLFRSAGVPLAEIYHMRPERGFVFLQDLGDSTIYELYADWNEATTLRHYLKALEYTRAIEKLPPAKGLAFDADKFLWELNYFRDNFLCGLRGHRLTQIESDTLNEYFLRLAGEVANSVSVFCHRDYHSRNLMVHKDCLYVVDFQDARLGPATYDLASLLYDSYVHLDPSFRNHVERMFFTHHPDPHLQRFEYPRMCLQRNLKALGTFGYQSCRLGRDFYHQFVDPTLAYIQRHFRQLPEYSDFHNLLSHFLPELA